MALPYGQMTLIFCGKAPASKRRAAQLTILTILYNVSYQATEDNTYPARLAGGPRPTPS